MTPQQKSKKKRTIEVEIIEVPERNLFLTEYLGEGTMGDMKFEASFTLPKMSMIVTVEKKRYIVNSQTLIKAMIKYHEANKNN